MTSRGSATTWRTSPAPRRPSGDRRTPPPTRALLRRAVALLALAWAGVWPTLAQAPWGDDFQVNTYTTGSPSPPDVAVAPDGDFLIVWPSEGSSGTDNSGRSIQGQLFDEEGNAVGSEFQVNQGTAIDFEQIAPAVAADADGDFVVVYSSFDDGWGKYNVVGQRLDASANPVGSEFRVTKENNYFTGYEPDVAFDPQGDFVVVWRDDYGTDDTIFGRRYFSGGGSLDEFQISTVVADLRDPAIAVDSQSNFVVVWESNGSSGSDTDENSIQAQRFDAGANPVGSQFQVNTATTGFQAHPEVTFGADDGFVVVWSSLPTIAGGPPFDATIQAQRFDAAGNPVGSEFQVNSYDTDLQYRPDIATGPDGGFTVVWDSEGPAATDASQESIRGRRFDAAGAAVGDEFQVNSYTTSSQIAPAIAFDPDGDLVVAWQSGGSAGSDDSSGSVQARQFRVQMTIGDRVWQDLDFDGIQDVGEPGFAGIPVRLRDGLGDPVVETVTDGSGLYELKTVETGAFHLEVEAPISHSFTSRDVGPDDTLDSDVDPVFGQTIDILIEKGVDQLQWDAGLARGVGNRVWLDNGDGVLNGGEPGIADVVIRLYDDQDNVVASTTTGPDGTYALQHPYAGTWYLELDLPTGMAFAPANQQANGAFDSDFSPLTGTTSPFFLAQGDVDTTWDAGLEPAVIGNRAWSDLNGDGRQQPGEPGVADVTVRLLDDQGAVVATTVTDADGIYQFAGVGSGSYQVEFVLPGGAGFALPDIGGDDLIDSDADPVTGRTPLFTYAQDSASRSHDAGLVVDPGYVFADGFESGNTSAWQ